MNFRKIALLVGLAFAQSASAVQLGSSNVDAVKLERVPYWNLSLVKADSTHYKLTGKASLASSGLNYGFLGIGTNTYQITKDISLTQGACNTLWGSSANTNAFVYAAYANSQATSVSNSSPSTDISGGTATTLKATVDGQPVVSVVIPSLTGLNTGAKIATELQTDINAALVAGGFPQTSVAVAYSTVYTITSNLKGNRSSVVIANGATNDVATTLKLGVANSGTETAGFVGPALCVSNTGGQTTVGSTALGSSGYMSCTTALLPSTTAVRQVAYNALNCTGPVIGTITELGGPTTITLSQLDTGITPSHVVKFAGSYTTLGGSATEAQTLAGVLSTDVVIATLKTKGGTPRTILTAAPTSNTITYVFSGDPSTDHVVSYEVLRAAN